MKKCMSWGVLAFLLFLMGCGDKEPRSAHLERPQISGVTVMKIGPSSIDSFYETSGTIKAGTTSVVASRTMGTILAVKVKEGDRVKAGEVIMTLDDRDLTEKVAQAEAAHQEALKALDSAEKNKTLAEVTAGRYRNLYAEKVITKQEMDQIETQNQVAAAEYGRLQEMVKRTKAAATEATIVRGFSKVTAPLSGLVTERKVDPGSLAAPGMPLFTIEDTSYFKVEANVDEHLFRSITKGTRVDLILEATGERITSSIGEIVPAVDPASRTFLVKIPLRGKGIQRGLYCRVQIPEGKKEVILVPKRAVVERGQLTGVFLVDDQKMIRYRLIRTGKRYGDGIEVLSGLKGGEQIITDGTDRAVDGGMLKP